MSIKINLKSDHTYMICKTLPNESWFTIFQAFQKCSKMHENKTAKER